MILITGASGNLGSAVVAQLLKTLSPEDFVTTSSNAAGVEKLKAKGLQSRLANFSDPITLNEAFKGIDKLLLISTMDQNRYEQHKNVVDAAKKQGVKQIIYTGLAIKDIHTSAVQDLMISHFQTEDYIKESGLTYTILRNTMYADALSQILGSNALHQDINLPGGIGKVPYALRREIGEATANLLLQDGHENNTYNITGSNSLGYTELAAALSHLTRDTIKYNDISEDDLKAFLKQIGFADFAIYLHSGTIHDIKMAQYEIESHTMETLLGRPTASIEDIIKELFKN
ncbi:SDR family oxidoreductase [Chryseobacterium carnipullorum]|uniref:Quinone oxidoreductase 2 n=1 Tax=Chryseobacterium carnipullorum TaxID=1124835 RepID=A0A376DRY2_CHRCU|nr:SDR family oxidoreductase [Chryseobacterium carnipullorum]AZA49431.1 SDR family oxidoreductase [Chryseobacterium carnipullorum]AZA64322.1 SDR family oxidoreductase [Chryseobacterium carnipullorum]STC94331.1 Quinone oxidoreductase 2 [Chryseobacterium carnipullorum]